MSDDLRFGLSRTATLPGPLRLDGGVLLSPVDVAYETYGTLAPDGGNAILVCHALTGDHHLASDHPVTGKPGWWARMVGPGKPIDTDRYFVICANVLGSCLGSSGPASINPATGKPWAMAFPVITIRDMETPLSIAINVANDMADIINLNKARKARARTDKAVHSQENRARFGRTKAQKQADAAETAKVTRLLDESKRD